MLRVGLTGGMGCGKSSVAAMMRELGCCVIAADPLAHQLTEPGQPAYVEIVRDFGRRVVAPDGRIDRAKLAEIVFANSYKLWCLNEIVHPRVIDALEQRMAALENEGGTDVVVVEAALLAERGYHQRLHRLVVTWCRPEQQTERLLARGLSRQDAERRIASQMPLEEKRKLATDEIDCSGTLDETRRQVEALVGRLKQLAAT